MIFRGELHANQTFFCEIKLQCDPLKTRLRKHRLRFWILFCVDGRENYVKTVF